MKIRSILFAVAALALVPVKVGGQRICDPELKPASAEIYPYAMRGDRCEGLYEIELSDKAELPVAGLMVLGRDVRYRGSRRVYLRWREQQGNVRLRVESLRWRTFYRMDAFQPASGRLFSWPTVILSTLDLSRSEVAALAWLDEGLTASRRIHLPVAVDTSAGVGTAAAYELVIVPTTEFARVHMTLYRVLPSGGLQLVGPPDVQVGEPPHDRDAEIRVRVPLTGTLSPGDYEIRLSGQREVGGWVTTVFRFRHDASRL